MMWFNLLLSVACSTAIFAIFKIFDTKSIDTRKAIVVNYMVAGLFGVLLLDNPIDFVEIPSKPWFWMSCILGFLFISLFNLMAFVAQKVGISTASVASKISVIIPVSAAILLYGDSLTLLKIIGIVLALIGLYLATHKSTKRVISLTLTVLPILLFIGTGLLDTLLKYSEFKVVPAEDKLLFIPSIFLMAFIIGLVTTGFQAVLQKDVQFELKNVTGGLILGIVNYGSIYFLWGALAQSNAESSVVFPLANMGVVAGSSLLGFGFFKEKLSRNNWIGISICLIAIALIAFA
jgi:drug/metabolite transporter (DMT)-like permease